MGQDFDVGGVESPWVVSVVGVVGDLDDALDGADADKPQVGSAEAPLAELGLPLKLLRCRPKGLDRKLIDLCCFVRPRRSFLRLRGLDGQIKREEGRALH